MAHEVYIGAKRKHKELAIKLTKEWWNIIINDYNKQEEYYKNIDLWATLIPDIDNVQIMLDSAQTYMNTGICKGFCLGGVNLPCGNDAIIQSSNAFSIGIDLVIAEESAPSAKTHFAVLLRPTSFKMSFSFTPV